MLVSPNAATAGTASFTMNPDNGLRAVLHAGLENVTGSANVTVSAPGFTGGSHPRRSRPDRRGIRRLNTDTTTLSADGIDWYVAVGIPCPGNTHLCTGQTVRGGAPPFIVALTLAPAQTPIAQLRSDQPVSTGQSVTKPISPASITPWHSLVTRSMASRSIPSRAATVTAPARRACSR